MGRGAVEGDGKVSRRGRWEGGAVEGDGKVSRRGRWEGGAVEGDGKVSRRGRWEGGAVEGDKGILCTLRYTSCAPPLSNLPHQNTTSL